MYIYIYMYDSENIHTHICIYIYTYHMSLHISIYIYTWRHPGIATWGRGWMTKASGVGERRKGRGELRRDCHHRVAALFVPTRMQQWYIDMWYITMIYMGEGAGGGPFAGKITWCPWGAPEYVLKQEDSSELTLAFVIMTIIANNDKM